MEMGSVLETYLIAYGFWLESSSIPAFAVNDTKLKTNNPGGTGGP